MFIYKVFIWILLIVVIKANEVEKTVPYLIPVNVCNIRYIKLNNLGSGTFSAPPLAILDIPKLSTYSCFINIRTRKYALGIPVIFWNSTYIDNLNNQRLVVDNTGKNIIKIIPPSNILKFQIIWRRSDIHENEILLDSSWYDSELNYILPMSQTFIMEFDAGNSSQKLCNQMKNDLISIPTQRQELEIKFKNTGLVEKKLPEVIIKSNDLCSVDTLRSNCGNTHNRRYDYPYYNYVNTYIYLTSAKQVAYDAATNVMKRIDMQVTELQEQIRKLIFNYLCETQVPYSPSHRKVIGTSNVKNSQTKICLIPSDVIYNNGTVGVINSFMVPGQNDEFSIPILNSM